MANTVTKAAVYNAILDEVVTAGLTSAPLTANQSRLVYNGGNSVKIAKLSTDGYSDYNLVEDCIINRCGFCVYGSEQIRSLYNGKYCYQSSGL